MPLAYSYIRFSTAEQTKGDSFRRQFELSRSYAEERGLTIDDNLSMFDLGVSAFSGDNLERGALGKFLDAVQRGFVPAGSFLLIESLDRLSRETVLTALSLFMSIIERGITIVTVSDRREYSRESIQANYTELIVSIAVMARAHEESLTKSHRISKAWEQKRADAMETGKVLTKVTPFWLTARDDRSGYDINEEGAKIVRRIFDMSLKGIGVYRIATTLNNEGLRSPKGKHWLQASVAKILGNRAVIGEATFNSFKNVDGRRLPVDPIPNYYPPVIEPSVFYAAREQMEMRKRVGRGRAGDSRNLFKGILSCRCGATMPVFSNIFGPDDRKRVNAKLRCMGQRLHTHECSAPSWDYYDFQYQFLQFVQEFDISSILNDHEECEKESLIKSLIADNKAKHQESELKLNRLLKMIESSDEVPTTVLQRISELEKERADLEFAGSVLKTQYQAFVVGQQAIRSKQDVLKSLIVRLNDPTTDGPYDYWEYDEEQLELRDVLSQQIRTLVREIRIDTVGVQLHGMSKPSARSFTITFNNGLTRVVVPKTGLTMPLDLRKKKKEGI